jgi:hypothetical protein
MIPLSVSLSLRKQEFHCTRCGDDGGCGIAVMLVLEEFMGGKKKKKKVSADVSERPVSSTPILYALLPNISP